MNKTEQNMVQIDEAAVLSHGKALAAQDGFTWEIDFSVLRGTGPRLGGYIFSVRLAVRDI